MGVVTALTAQNTSRVQGVDPVDSALVSAQIEALLADVHPHAIKIGMLSSRGNVHAVADTLAGRYAGPIVLDPVVRASSGAPLLSAEGIDSLLDRLLPLATIVTPNLDEAARLTGVEVHTVGDMERAAEALHSRGARHALITGGHLRGETLVDVFFDGARIAHLSGCRVPGPSPHGTGCVLSSAIAAHLALGDAVDSAVARGIDFVRMAIRNAAAIGGGQPVLVLQPKTARWTNQ
jgi:hydroxymethylpyrimidine/phosphomethylpyrimidine kinase